MSGNERFYISRCMCETNEDSYAKGEVFPSNGSTWFPDPTRRVFESVRDALEYVCGYLALPFDINDWERGEDSCGDADGTFFADVLVDEDNFAVRKNDRSYAKWKAGEINLWNLRIYVRFFIARLPVDDDFKDWRTK